MTKLCAVIRWKNVTYWYCWGYFVQNKNDHIYRKKKRTYRQTDGWRLDYRQSATTTSVSHLFMSPRRLRMAGHIIRMPPGRPANRAMSWTPHGSGRKRGRPTKTWRSTFKEDLVDRGVDWNSVRAVATDRHRWRTLAAHCPDKDWRI